MSLYAASDSDNEDDDTPEDTQQEPTPLQPRAAPPQPTAAREEAALEEQRRREYQVDTNVMLDLKYYIDKDVFLEAVQDLGTVDPKSGDQQLIYHPKMKSMSLRMYQVFKSEKFPDLPANSTRAWPVICNAINMKRKQVGLSYVDQEFHKYSADGKQVFIINNNTKYYGYNQILAEIHYHFQKCKKKKSKDRSPSDAIRVAAVMLAEEHKKAVTKILSGSRTVRAQSDQSVDPVLAWAMDAIAMFKDANFFVDQPIDCPDGDVEGVDPNSYEVVSGEPSRDAKWFLDTWRLYLKKKYKDAIKKWDTETGGGSHDAEEFGNFCGRDRWLTWVYLMDMKAGYLLFQFAKGTPPEHVGCEPGAEIVAAFLNSNEEDEDGVVVTPRLTASGNKRPPKTDSLRKEYTDRQNRVGDLLEKHAAYLYSRDAVVANDVYAQCIQAHKKLKQFEETLCYMSPTSKNKLMKGARKEMDGIHKRMLTMADAVDDSDDD